MVGTYLFFAIFVCIFIFNGIKAIRNKKYSDLLISLFTVPFFVFAVSSIIFGGDAFHNAAKDYPLYEQGHYYLCSHANYTEVSRDVFVYMKTIGIIGLISFGIAFIWGIIRWRNNADEDAITPHSGDNERTLLKIPYTYYKRGFVISILLLAIVFGIIIIDILSLTRAIPIDTIPSVTAGALHVLMIILFPLFMIPKIMRSYSLVREKEADAVITQGIIQDIKKANDIGGVGGYTQSGKILHAHYIEIDDLKYYSIGGADGLKVGMQVEIKYLPTSKFILEIKRTLSEIDEKTT